MKKTLFAVTTCCLALTISVACAPKAVLFDVNNAPDNERCNYMKEVCKEAQKFQSQYESMSREERTDAKVILNAYVQQCQDAQVVCQRTIE